MGCCILGAIIIGMVVRSWRGIRDVLGLSAAASQRPSAAMWRPGAPEVAVLVANPSPAYYRLAMVVVMLPVMAYGLYVSPLRTMHGKLDLELAQTAIRLGVPPGWLLPICSGLR